MSPLLGLIRHDDDDDDDDDDNDNDYDHDDDYEYDNDDDDYDYDYDNDDDDDDDDLSAEDIALARNDVKLLLLFHTLRLSVVYDLVQLGHLRLEPETIEVCYSVCNMPLTV